MGSTKKILSITLCTISLFMTSFADEIILQNGVNNYDGCIDATIDNSYMEWGKEPTLSVNRILTCHEAIARTIIRFDLSSLPQPAKILDAQLAVFIDYSSEEFPGQEVALHSLSGSWHEETVTWGEKNSEEFWTTEGGDFSSTILAKNSYMQGTNGIWLSFNVLDYVKECVSDPSKNHGFLIKGEESVDYSVEFKSSQIDDVQNRPKLTIQYEKITSLKSVNTTGTNTIKPMARIMGNGIRVYLPGSNDIYSITILSMTGKTIQSISIPGNNTWSTVWGNFSNGLYLCRIQSNNQITEEKLAFPRMR